MADLTYLAKGLNMIGQSYLANKSAQRQYMNQVALEKLKQDSWLRNLQEQNRRYEITQQRILEQHQAEQQRQAMVESAKAYKDVELAKIREAEEKDKFEELVRHNKAMERVGTLKASKTGQPKSTSESKDTTLDDLLKLRKAYEGVKSKDGVMIGADESMLKDIDNRIKRLGTEKYGLPDYKWRIIGEGISRAKRPDMGGTRQYNSEDVLGLGL